MIGLAFANQQESKAMQGQSTPKLLTVTTSTHVYFALIPGESREAEYPNGKKYLLVPAPRGSEEFGDDEGFIGVDPEWMPDFIQNDWPPFLQLSVRERSDR